MNNLFDVLIILWIAINLTLTIYLWMVMTDD